MEKRLFLVHLDSIYVCAATPEEAVTVARTCAPVGLVMDETENDHHPSIRQESVFSGKGHSKCKLCMNSYVSMGSDPDYVDTVGEWQDRRAAIKR